MNTKEKALYEGRAKIIKSLAHPSRLIIIDCLSEKGECCVQELTEIIGADISTVSKHLSLLKNSGLIVDEKRANQVFYRLKAPCIMKFFGCVEAVMRQDIKEKMKIVI